MRITDSHLVCFITVGFGEVAVFHNGLFTFLTRGAQYLLCSIGSAAKKIPSQLNREGIFFAS